MGGGRAAAPTHQGHKPSAGAPAPVASTLNNNLYSLQQAAGGTYNSLSLNANQNALGQNQNHTLNYHARGGGTLIVTREDFNIEDIHCQMVFKV